MKIGKSYPFAVQIRRRKIRSTMMQGLSSMLVRRLMKSTAAIGYTRAFASETVQSGAALERSLNHVQLLGRVGNDPQKRGSEERPVVIFSLATHNSYKSKTGEGIEQVTDWHRICVFKPRLKDTVYNFLKKGQRVYVTGRLSYGEVADSNSSSGKVIITSIIADDVIFFAS